MDSQPQAQEATVRGHDITQSGVKSGSFSLEEENIILLEHPQS